MSEIHHAGVHRPRALPDVGGRAMAERWPLPRPVRAGPGGVRAHRRVPRRSGQRAMAPADPAGSSCSAAGSGESFLLRQTWQPWLIAFFYYHGVLAALRDTARKWATGSTPDFEDHAEHEYMALRRRAPRAGSPARPRHLTPPSYGQHGSLADLFRQIGHDGAPPQAGQPHQHARPASLPGPSSPVNPPAPGTLDLLIPPAVLAAREHHRHEPSAPSSPQVPRAPAGQRMDVATCTFFR